MQRKQKSSLACKALLLFLALPHTLFAEPSERAYAEKWAAQNGGKVEVTMPDKSRCDVVTKTHAVEVKRAALWKSAIGQALWYSFQVNKKAGIVLIVKDDNDYLHALKLRSLIREKKLPIDVWTMKAKL